MFTLARMVATGAVLTSSTLLAASCTVAEDDVAKDIAVAECAPLFSDCPCTVAAFTKDECVAKLTQAWNARFAAAKERGLLYDGSCAARTIDAIDRNACRSPNQPGRAFCEDEQPCSIYVGTRADGESCSIREDGFSDCAQGLTCGPGADGTRSVCTLTCPTIPREGEACRDIPCASGFFCGPSAKCERDAAEGESCLMTPCTPGTWCNADHACAPLTDVGGPCHQDFECASGTCDSETCLVYQPTLCTASL